VGRWEGMKMEYLCPRGKASLIFDVMCQPCAAEQGKVENGTELVRGLAPRMAEVNFSGSECTTAGRCLSNKPCSEAVNSLTIRLIPNTLRTP
jgi:hypothetical protein